jgi:hypothetical protein
MRLQMTKRQSKGRVRIDRKVKFASTVSCESGSGMFVDLLSTKKLKFSDEQKDGALERHELFAAVNRVNQKS